MLDFENGNPRGGPTQGKCATLLTDLMRTWLVELNAEESGLDHSNAVAVTAFDGSKESFTVSLANVLADERLREYGLCHSLPFVVRCFPDLYECASIDSASCIIVSHGGQVLIKVVNMDEAAVHAAGNRVLQLDVNDLVKDQIQILSEHSKHGRWPTPSLHARVDEGSSTRKETNYAAISSQCCLNYFQTKHRVVMGSVVWAGISVLTIMVLRSVFSQ